jgi:tricorn protease
MASILSIVRSLLSAGCASILASVVLCGAARAAGPLLLRNPSLSANEIAFLYADDIWTVSRDGGEAQRLTSIGAVTEGPYFSPDGKEIAYSTLEHGEVDVYVVNAEGGVPRRLTWDPEDSYCVGWSADGKDVLFGSMHASYSDFFRLFEAHADGTGMPTVLPLPSALTGNFSADGNTIAYEPILQWEDAWKHYRGGQTKKVWLVNLKTLDLVKVPRENSNDFDPVWEGKTVYFLSDRNGPVSLWSYDTESKAVTQVLENHGYDLKTVSAGPGALVYEQFGSVHLYDLATKQEHSVAVTIHGDLPELRPRLQNIAAHEMQNVEVSPTGLRVVAEAHGEIFTLPVEKGDTRNLTKTSGSAERDPAWSPDGKSIASVMHRVNTSFI